MPLPTSGPSSSSQGSLYSVQLTLRQEVMPLPLPCHCCIHQVFSCRIIVCLRRSFYFSYHCLHVHFDQPCHAGRYIWTRERVKFHWSKSLSTFLTRYVITCMENIWIMKRTEERKSIQRTWFSPFTQVGISCDRCWRRGRKEDFLCPWRFMHS